MAYAIVETGGLQFKVEDQAVLEVPKLDASEGDTVTLDRVLLFVGDGRVSVGRPLVEGVSVRAKVLAHFRGPKIIVYKQKRRKNYRRKRGHRQSLTRLQVTEMTSAA